MSLVCSIVWSGTWDLVFELCVFGFKLLLIICRGWVLWAYCGRTNLGEACGNSGKKPKGAIPSYVYLMLQFVGCFYFMFDFSVSLVSEASLILLGLIHSCKHWRG